MEEIKLEAIQTDYNKCESEEEEESDESDLELMEEFTRKENNKQNNERGTEQDMEEEEEGDEADYEDEESDSSSDEEEEELKLDFEPILFALWKDFQFLFRITSTNPTTSIYKAIDIKTTKEVCVKISLTRSNSTPIEVKVLEHIRRVGGHQNVQKIVSVFHQHCTAWVLVTEYVNSDRDYESKYLFTNEDKIRSFMKQLFQGLDFLHSNNLIHRDVKPSNLLWDNTNEKLVICDFDLACWNHSKGHTASCGTDSFLASELIAFDRDVPFERKNYFQEIDLYSAGCTFAGLQHSVLEDNMKEKYIYSWRQRYSKKTMKSSDDELFLRLVEHDPQKRISAKDALLSSYILNK